MAAHRYLTMGSSLTLGTRNAEFDKVWHSLGLKYLTVFSNVIVADRNFEGIRVFSQNCGSQTVPKFLTVVRVQTLPRSNQKLQIFVLDFDLLFQHHDDVVLAGAHHSGVGQVGLEPAPLALLEAPADDHCKLPASVDAVDRVLSEGDADLEVPVVDAAAKSRILVFEFWQKFFCDPFVTILKLKRCIFISFDLRRKFT